MMTRASFMCVMRVHLMPDSHYRAKPANWGQLANMLAVVHAYITASKLAS